VAKTFGYGPNGSSVPDVSGNIGVLGPALNYDLDFREIESGTGFKVYTDITSPVDQPATIRIAHKERANVYAGTSIDPSVYLPTRRGVDTIIEVREVWTESDSEDSSYLRQVPVRAAITLTLPAYGNVSTEDVEHLLSRLVVSLFEQSEDSIDTGLEALLHGVVDKRD
jgi:hypothetical protein